MHLKKTPEGTEISRYAGILTAEKLGANIKKLSAAFPRQSELFYDILTERIIANGFTDERLTDAVNNLIDNFKYKEISIADVVGYDKTIRLYTHQEVEMLIESYEANWNDFELKEVEGKTYRVKKTDLLNK